MSKLMNFSKDKFDQSKPLELLYPDGTAMGATVYIHSLKSRYALAKLDEIRKRNNQMEAQGTDVIIQRDREMCCAIIDSIDGFTISPEDNSLELEVDGEKIISNKKNIEILMENFPFIVKQIVAKASDDHFFYAPYGKTLSPV